MQFEIGEGSDYLGPTAASTVELLTYPLDKVGGTVRVEFVAEPSAPGHKEFAATTMHFSGPYLAVIEVRDRNGWEPFDDTVGPYGGERFYRETIAHEIGHVIAGVYLRTNAARAEMAALFRYQDVIGERDESVGLPSQWRDGEWPDHLEEAVAETFKDVFLPTDRRQYDNRTNWRLPQENFVRFLELIGLDFEGAIGVKDNWLYTPDRGHILEHTDEDLDNTGWAPYGEPGWWDHADVQFVPEPNTVGVVGDEKPWWTWHGRSFPPALGYYQLHELATGERGGTLFFDILTWHELAGRAVRVFGDLSMPVDLTGDESYTGDRRDPESPSFYDAFGDPAEWEAVGWGSGGQWAKHTNFIEYGPRWRLLIGAWQGTPVDDYLLACSGLQTGPLEGAPSIDGVITVPSPAVLASLGWDGIGDITLTLILRFEHQYTDPSGQPKAYDSMPAGPGVVEAWAQRRWGITWTMAPDEQPPWPYRDRVFAGSADPLSVRRSKAIAGV